MKQHKIILFVLLITFFSQQILSANPIFLLNPAPMVSPKSYPGIFKANTDSSALLTWAKNTAKQPQTAGSKDARFRRALMDWSPYAIGCADDTVSATTFYQYIYEGGWLKEMDELLWNIQGSQTHPSHGICSSHYLSIAPHFPLTI